MNMSLSDCVKCWDTPCTCGYDYKDYSKRRRIELASVVLGIDYDTLKRHVKKHVPKKHPMHERE